MEYFGSKSASDKHKNNYDVYDNILEDFSKIPFQLSDRFGQNIRIWMGKKIVNISIILKKNLTSGQKSTN